MHLPPTMREAAARAALADVANPLSNKCVQEHLNIVKECVAYPLISNRLAGEMAAILAELFPLQYGQLLLRMVGLAARDGRRWRKGGLTSLVAQTSTLTEKGKEIENARTAGWIP